MNEIKVASYLCFQPYFEEFPNKNTFFYNIRYSIKPSKKKIRPFWNKYFIIKNLVPCINQYMMLNYT